MADDPEDDRPQYNVYRSKPRLRGRGDEQGLDDLRRDEAPGDHGPGPGPSDGAPDYEVHRAGGRGRPRLPGIPIRRRRRGRGGPGRIPGRRFAVGRILRFAVGAAVAWVLVSAILFMVSAQIASRKVDSAAGSVLSGGGFPLTSPNTILVLGSDARPKGSKEPGATTLGSAGPQRSDSMLLLRVGGGANSTLSILRDTVVPIPGHGTNKINAAYAFGGPELAVQTVEQYLGVEVNHLVEVNFENFPQLIDALGGVTYKGDCVVSRLNGGYKNGGYTLRLKRGTHEIDGKQALALARTRHNECRPQEDDRARVRRQQKILAAMKGKVTSLETFIRLPWVSWAAPQAVRSDMSGPSLLGLIGAEMTSGKGERQVLKPSGFTQLPDGGSGLTVDEAAKQAAVQRFLKG
jgi:LCP family protein required for cell wall assembly